MLTAGIIPTIHGTVTLVQLINFKFFV